MPVTLRTNSRKQEPQTIPNTNNWLFRLIRKELADYFPDIQTAKDARQELERRKPSAGSKPMNTRYPIVAYGIYRMLHAENAMSENPDTPNELCRLIYDYTRFVGCYPSYKGYDGSFNPKKHTRRHMLYKEERTEIRRGKDTEIPVCRVRGKYTS